MMAHPTFQLAPGSMESRLLQRLRERRREIIDAALRGGHPYDLAKRWSLEEVPEAEMERVQNAFNKAVADSKKPQPEPTRPWWWIW